MLASEETHLMKTLVFNPGWLLVMCGRASHYFGADSEILQLA